MKILPANILVFFLCCWICFVFIDKRCDSKSIKFLFPYPNIHMLIIMQFKAEWKLENSIKSMNNNEFEYLNSTFNNHMKTRYLHSPWTLDIYRTIRTFKFECITINFADYSEIKVALMLLLPGLLVMLLCDITVLLKGLHLSIF